MKEINMYVRGIVKNIESEPYRQGLWVTALEYNKHFKVVRGTVDTGRNGRVIIIGIIEGVKLLKEPCIINLYTHASFFDRTKDQKRNEDYMFRPVGTHKDLLVELEQLLNNNDHILNINIGGKYQRELMKYL
jgi:hypothetical protein